MTTRRAFLKTGAAGGAALVVGFRFSIDALAQEAQEKKKPSPFDAWIHIDKSGTVTLITAKSEMGQGALTAMPMILAEELEVDWDGVRVEQAPTDPSIYDHGTGGSGSVAGSWLPLRQAGAAAREMLVRAAATAWNVEPATCRAEKGFIVHGPRRRRLAYGELVEAASKLPIPDFNKVPLKNPDDFHIVGQSIARTDIPSKVDGSARFGIDVRVPGLLYAVVARCPTFGGKAARFDATKAKAIAGVRHVLEIPAVGAGAHTAGGIAVVADSTWAAMQGRRALQIDWDHGPHASESSQTLRQASETIAAQPGKVVRNEGDAAAALVGAEQKVDAVYELPFQAHATMEPMNCTVDIRADRAEAWSPTQAPDWTRSAIAQVTGLPPPSINVHTTLMGGGFGRRYQADFVVEAAQVGKAVGAPVQLLWTREDDMQHDFYRPFAYHRLSGAVDAKGNAVAWHHRIVSTSIRSFWDPPDRVKPEASEIGGAVDLAYAVPNLRVEYAPVPSGVPVAWWRSVEASLNAFVVEGFIDELAAAAKADPLAFRQRLLAEPRMIKQPPDSESALDTRRFKGVLDLAAAKAGWGSPLPAGRGRGIACAFSFDSYVAEVAEVSLNSDKSVRVHRVVAAVDCGQIVNPAILEQQIQGGIVYGLGNALRAKITIEKGRVVQGNFDDYAPLRMDETPTVEVYAVPSAESPTGIGEPSVPPVAPALCNAIFAATKKRIRALPILS